MWHEMENRPFISTYTHCMSTIIEIFQYATKRVGTHPDQTRVAGTPYWNGTDWLGYLAFSFFPERQRNGLRRRNRWHWWKKRNSQTSGRIWDERLTSVSNSVFSGSFPRNRKSNQRADILTRQTVVNDTSSSCGILHRSPLQRYSSGNPKLPGCPVTLRHLLTDWSSLLMSYLQTVLRVLL